MGAGQPYGCEGMPGAGEGAEDETNKFENRKTNLECPLESTKAKNGLGKGRLNPKSVCRCYSLSHSLPTGYTVTRLNVAEYGVACIVLQERGLSFRC